MFSILVVFLSIVALGFLIFIHELGHYYMAKKVGMKVEVFSIGFGSAIYSWVSDGVKWQLGWIPLGGYVKIAGTDTDKGEDPYLVKDGFFGKSPWDRLKVAFMGPAVNIVFALLVFSLLWVEGGRLKNFSEYTHVIGWIDPKSDLYSKGIRPGDEISSYNNMAYNEAKDHISQPLTSGGEIEIKGYRVNYGTEDKTPFAIKVKTYPFPFSLEKDMVTSGILAPASYLVYDRLAGGAENPLPESSPMENSGIQYGDRIVWLDGHLIFSQPQLSSILNDGRALLTVQRGNQTLLVRVPRFAAEEYKLDPEFKEELIDWQYEADLKGTKLSNLWIIPYNLTNEGVVENRLKFIDKEKDQDIFGENTASYLEALLHPRDHILAVDGVPVKYSYQILQRLQNRQVSIIVERGDAVQSPVDYNLADSNFNKDFDLANIDKIANSIGTAKTVKKEGKYLLLNPVTPRMRSEFVLTPEKQAWVKSALVEAQKQIDSIDDSETREKAQKQLDISQKELAVGLPALQDRKVTYNPIPTNLFANVFTEIKRTFSSLLTGNLGAKWLSGPVGIVRVVHSQAMLSFNDMLFWIGAISLNLGILNLLPIPMLDGGTIVFSLFEMVTKRKIKPKTLEKIILPFAILLILFFVYVTYYDLERLFRGFFK